MAEQSINIPQVIVFLVVTFLVGRWYLSKPSGQGTRAAPTRAPPRINPEQIEHVAQMFPQLSRRDIAWDLQRNGGNVAATTERALSGRGLDTPPASFNVPAPRVAATPARATPAMQKPAHPDLITRYNLASKINKDIETAEVEQPKAKSWSADRNERQANLQRRREEMILAARRKLEQQDKGKAKADA